jgi:hypothetical protein
LFLGIWIGKHSLKYLNSSGINTFLLILKAVIIIGLAMLNICIALFIFGVCFLYKFITKKHYFIDQLFVGWIGNGKYHTGKPIDGNGE